MSTPYSPTMQLALELIRRPSVTPEDSGCQELIATRLAKLGFSIEPMPFAEVTNLWARRGDAAPLVCFAGHTDVVPTGPIGRWTSPPFVPTRRDGRLYGRGAVDMKGGLACALAAVLDHLSVHGGTPKGSISFLITGDEEGIAVNGTRKVLDWMAALKVPLVLVVGGYLGTISHTLTALDVLRQRHLTIATVAGSESERNPVELDETVASIQRFARGAPVMTSPRRGTTPAMTARIALS